MSEVPDNSTKQSFHARFREVVDRIEREFDVAEWRADDLDLWPLAKMDLYLDMVRRNCGETSAPPIPLLPRVARLIATPLSNLWRSRRDPFHWAWWPRPAYAVVLGDGVSLDRIEGEWCDRYAEPLMSKLAKQGRSIFLMQGGEPSRIPWRRRTFAANVISGWGAVVGALPTKLSMRLPDHSAVLCALAKGGIDAPSLRRHRLARRAGAALFAAFIFVNILRVSRPRIAFVVTYYAGLGHAFVLACRRLGILSVDLQHCPQSGGHKAYGWSSLSERGYTTLPAVFWNWSQEDAASIDHWARTLSTPWHRSLYGGHTQLAPFLDDTDPRTRVWDETFRTIGMAGPFEREILVALQPIGGYRDHWTVLAKQIAASPPRWRWWIRRHPASTAHQDAEYSDLLRLRRPNVNFEDACSLPLPALLRHMSAVLSLASGAAVEAAAFGTPVFFLSDEASDAFAGLIKSGQATVIDVHAVNEEISRVRAKPVRPRRSSQPALEDTLRRLEIMALDYSQLCRDTAKSSTDALRSSGLFGKGGL